MMFVEAFHWRFMRLAIWAFTLILLSSGFGQAQNIPTKLVGEREITRELGKLGSARVIVLLSNDVDIEKLTRQLSSPRDRSSTLTKIKLDSDAVRRDYFPTGRNSRGKDVKSFDLLPAFATDVSTVELQRMQKDSRIFKIMHDEMKTTNLNSSLELFGLGQQQISVNPDAAPNGLGRTAAVIDTGVQRDHPFITSARVIAEGCYLLTGTCPGGRTSAFGAGTSAPASGESHGTHVAGIIMGRYANLSPVNRGVASKASLVMVNVFGAQGGAYDSDIISALEFIYRLKTGTDTVYAQISTIDSVNMSLGGGTSYSGSCDGDAAAPVIKALRDVGVLTVIAAGNSYWTSGMSSPGCISTAVSVAATSKTGKVISSYSNVSATTTLFAPGGDFSTGCVASSVMGSSYDAYCGTSMAAPHVAGAIALLRAANGGVSSDAIVAALTTNMQVVSDTRSGGTHSKPFLDVQTALANINSQKFTSVSFSLSGTGLGSVTSSTGSLACQNKTCSGTFVVGSTVIFTAVPDARSSFSAWSIPNVTCDRADCSVVIPDAVLTGGVTLNSAVVALADAVDDPTRTFSFSNTGTWYGLATEIKSSDGVDVARSPVLLDNQLSSFQTSVTGPGTLTFSWAVSSETSYDYLRFFINGVEQAGSISGAVGYQSKTWSIPCGGPHILKWTYSKDVSIAMGDDAGYVDKIAYQVGAGCSSPTLSVTISPNTLWGNVTSTTSGIKCGSTGTQCSNSFTSGATVVLNAKPVKGRKFVGWSGSCSGSSSSCTLSMTQARSVTAVFR